MITTTSLNPPPPKPYDAINEPQKLFALEQRLRRALGMVASESELWRLLDESLALLAAIDAEQDRTNEPTLCAVIGAEQPNLQTRIDAGREHQAEILGQLNSGTITPSPKS